jgi:hypothetical protein
LGEVLTLVVEEISVLLHRHRRHCILNVLCNINKRAL